MYPRKLTRSVISNPDYPVVQTRQGKLRGLWEEGTFLFRGVPYAQARRYQLPQPVPAWEGTRTAIIYGPVCPEIHTPIAHDQYNVPHYHYIQDEDCLYLNVWTQHLETDAKRPVMVWIHGGGFATGSSIELYAYDGMELSAFGDVVVVSVNHRLNVLGYLDLSAYGEQYRYTGNLGTADLVAALQWVHDNIAAFGGDPDNVTIMGQSGGGGKVNALLHTPSADGLYHKAVIQSGLSSGSRETLPAQSQALAAAVVARLGIEQIADIETVPYYRLARAAQAATADLAAQTGQRVGWGPVRDDDFYLGSGMLHPFRAETAHIPMLVGSVLGEFDQNYNNVYAPGSKNDWSDEQVLALIRQVYGDAADAVIAGQQQAYPQARLVDCLFTNRSMRTAHRDFCFKRAAEGCAPAWNWLFNLECPLNSGTVPWHNAEEAYMFHNANYLEASYIPGVSEQLQDLMTGAWVAFATTGDPNHTGLPLWPAATADNGACMIFDAETRLACHHDDALMAALPDKPMSMGGARRPTSTFGGGPRQSI